MKILDNPEGDSMLCVLPNGVVLEVTSVSLSGNNSTSHQDAQHVAEVVSNLPSAMLQDRQNCIL